MLLIGGKLERALSDWSGPIHEFYFISTRNPSKHKSCSYNRLFCIAQTALTVMKIELCPLFPRLTPVSQMEVGAHGGPGAAIVIAPQGARTPNWPAQTRNPATSPPRHAEGISGLDPTRSTRGGSGL